MAQKAVYRVASPGKFTEFLKRFSSIESTLLVEIEDGDIKAKTHTADRAVVKMSRMGLNEAFDFIDGTDEPIIFGLYNIDRFAGSFKHFGSDEFDLIIEYSKLEDKNIGTMITLKSKKLTITFDCASYRLFTHISDDLFMGTIADTSDLGTKFMLTGDAYARIYSLSSIDADLLKLKVQDNTISAKGESFDMIVHNSTEKIGNAEISFYTEHFGFVDKEDNEVEIAEDKVVFSSTESSTITVIGKTEE